MFKQFKLWQYALFFIVLILVTSLLIMNHWINQLDISKLNDPLPEPTFIYDRYGQPVSQLSSAKLTPIPLEQIPIDLRHAIVAIEDQRFYDHTGVDIRSIFRALIRNVSKGDTVEGGSTITQQLVKNLFLGSEKTMQRKINEAAYAIKIERTYSKDEILEMYLNQIYFGEGVWGVQQAAEMYFGKNVVDLDLPEIALIAALPKAPTHYSPFKNKDKALERRNLVLSLMLDQGYINQDQFEAAKASPIQLSQGKGNELKGKYASYVDYVMEEAISRYGFTEEQLLTGGLRIYTNLDLIVQQSMEAVYTDDQFFPESKEDQLIQSGAVVLDPYTGAIRGLMGSRGDHVFRGFNHATQLKRQPGSTLKPLAVYTPAFERGYSPNSILYDGELNIDGYRPRDWDNRTRSYVYLHEAVTQSWNIPAVWLLNEIGVQVGIDTLNKMGIPLTDEDRNLSIALGGLHQGISPLQLAQAYSVFPNMGKVKDAHAVTRITTKDGITLIEAQVNEVEVFTAKSAYQMNLLLQNVVQGGTGKRALLNRPTAGKTGTTQLPDTKEFAGVIGKGEKDAWFVGYTPEYVAAVWMGYDKTDREHYLNTSGGAHPAMVFKEILSRSLQNTPVTQFQVPEGWIEEQYVQKDLMNLFQLNEKQDKKPKKGKKNKGKKKK